MKALLRNFLLCVETEVDPELVEEKVIADCGLFVNLNVDELLYSFNLDD